MRVFVTGATGLVGSRLVQALRSRGDAVLALSRRPGPEVIQGDPTHPGPWLDSLERCDAVVHLAGEGIFAQRWSPSFKQRIHASRVDGARLIAERLAKNGRRDVAFVSCSAVGYYGDRGDEILTEASSPGSDFMATVCRDWEAAADPAREAGLRVVHPRLGIVLDPVGGAVPNLIRPYRMFVGGRVGSGKQFVSWIHHVDLTDVLIESIGNSSMSGPVNATAPNPVSNDAMGRTIAGILGRPHWLPVPRLALRIALGGISDALVASTRAIPDRLMGRRFAFRFPELESALRDVLAARG